MISLTRNESGFSFLEMNMVIAFIILICGISVPSFVNWHQYNELSKNALLFEDILNRAKNIAVETHQNIKLIIKNDGNGGKISLVNVGTDSFNCLNMSEETLLTNYYIETKITEKNGNYEMCFFPNGASKNITFKLQNKKKKFLIKINENTGFIEKTTN